MLVILKFLQSLIKTLHSEGTPTQIAAGIAIGAALGLTPLMNLHNIIILVVLVMFNVSFGAGLLGMAIFAPVGFILDPIFDRLGHWLLTDVAVLRPLWTWLDDTPVFALSNLDNTVVVGSLFGWLILTLPIFFVARVLVIKYRVSFGAWLHRTRLYNAIAASQVYNVYRWFSP
jgi:uncharacterized protein (TIGR03546 family)